MQVEAVLVDDVSLTADGKGASVAANLYEFSKPTWVTVHAERGGSPVGPVAVVSDDPSEQAALAAT